MREKENLSIILRNKNEEQYIGHAIQSILENVYKPEIIIIDNNSTDESLKIANSFKASHHLHSDHENYTDIKIVNINEYSPGKAINLGVKHCSNDYILVMSGHTIIKKFSLSKLIYLFKQDKNKDLAVIFGNQDPVWNGKKIQKRYMWENFTNSIIENMYSEAEHRYFLHNAFALYPKHILEKYPFDSDLIGKEDRYWINDRINIDKLNSLYDPYLMDCFHHYTINGNTWKGIG